MKVIRSNPAGDAAKEIFGDALAAAAASAGALLARFAFERNPRGARLIGNPTRRNVEMALAEDIELDPDVIDVAQGFHGREETHEIDLLVPLSTLPEHLAGLGLLMELKFVAEVDGALEDIGIAFDPAADSPVIVAYHPGENQIYFVGGDGQQDVSEGFTEETTRFVNVGPCTYIAYFTDKHHLQGLDEEQENGWGYEHLFGEETGVKPTLVFDRETRTLSLVGGEYTVEPDGIHN